MRDRVVLLNPGPVTLSARVRSALSEADYCHREPEFAAIVAEVRERLRQVHPDGTGRTEAVLLAGSGSLAVDAMLASFAPETGGTLVVANGVYGERLATSLRAQRKPALVLAGDWLEAPDLSAVDAALRRDPGLTHVAAVQHETTTGRLNPIAALGALCRTHGRRLLLDAVSSFGAEPLEWEAWALEAVAASANKCLHGAPGVAFVVAKAGALDPGRGPALPASLDLASHAAAQREGALASTLPTHVTLALGEALREHAEAGGAQGRRHRYGACAARVRRALDAAGVRLLLPEPARAPMLTAAYLPDRLSFAAARDGMRAAGFVIYGAQGRLQSSVFRLATMGDIADADLDRLDTAIAAVFGRHERR